MPTSIKFNGKEVRNPFLRFLLAGGAIALVAVILLVVAFGLMIIPILLGGVCLIVLLTLPLHFLLLLCGRRGFYVREGDTHTWTTTGAFSRRV